MVSDGVSPIARMRMRTSSDGARPLELGPSKKLEPQVPVHQSVAGLSTGQNPFTLSWKATMPDGFQAKSVAGGGHVLVPNPRDPEAARIELGFKLATSRPPRIASGTVKGMTAPYCGRGTEGK